MPTNTFKGLSEAKQRRIFDAALNEFSERSFSEAKLSNIIKEAKIPRGSFYQYFDDKMDLYKYVFYKIGDLKLGYMANLIHNPEEIPFLDLFRKLYAIGIQFAIDNPKAVKMAMFLYASKNLIYKEVLGDGLKQARDFYAGYIESDKKLGRINPEVDTDVFAEMMLNMINNISFDGLSGGYENVDFDMMLEIFNKKIYILEKGILVGDKNV